jgi:hypothetical protein
VRTRFAAVSANRGLLPLYARFAEGAGAVPLSDLVEMRLVLPSPDMVLRKVVLGRRTLLVPATPAMALVLRHGLEAAPAMDDLKRMAAGAGPVG